METKLKQPREVLDYDVDLSAWFASIPTDDIQSVDISITSYQEEVPTLVLGPAPHQPYILMGQTPVSFKIWLGGGTDRTEYIVTCVVRTEQDRQKEVEFKIKVRDV